MLTLTLITIALKVVKVNYFMDFCTGSNMALLRLFRKFSKEHFQFFTSLKARATMRTEENKDNESVLFSHFPFLPAKCASWERK